ncbi:hypothetical protein D3873_12030 [Paenisporosarcina cavernae]|uniref:Uncharacterized protein n=1 Tax=Paenisporosarcina cavernae TaxID=2320858 RepID=A0A385YVF6_9BACL|nr:hypothetical protein D3873_12030 [Paenisporosarcina cavernae]
MYKKRGILILCIGLVMLALAFYFMIMTFYVPQVGPTGETKVSRFSWFILIVMFFQAIYTIPYGIWVMNSNDK